MNRHDLDVLSLVAGLLFTGLAVTFVLDALDVWSADVTWVPAVVLIALGIGGLLSTLRRHAASPQPAVEEPESP